MINLINNEITKILKKKSTYIIIVIMLIFIVINNILYSRNYSNKGEKYIREAQEVYDELLGYKEQLDELKEMDKETEKQYKILVGEMEIQEYIIKNKQNVNAIGNNRYILSGILEQYDIFIVIYVILIAGTIVSEEFNKGTIKILLVKPYSRMKIFLSKFITCIIMLLFMTIILVLLQLLIGGLILDFSSLSVPIVQYNQATNELNFMNVFQYIGLDFLARLPMYLIILALAFACSTTMLSSTMAIVIPIFVYFFSSTINSFINGINAKWMKFIITLNWNFEPYLFGGKPEVKSLTFNFAVFICIIYFIIIMSSAIWSFKKRDIKNI